MTTSQSQIPELTLRRYRAGELDPETQAQVAEALATSPQLRTSLKRLDDEQAAFEHEIPFDRFVGGVRRAQRHARRPRKLWAYSSGAALAMAAAGFVVLMRPLPSTQLQTSEQGANRRKGDGPAATALAHVVGARSGGRVAEPGKLFALEPGDRVRLELRRRVTEGQALHIGVVSVDAQGQATAIYPEAGTSLTWPEGVSRYLLPDGLEFEGQGRETLFVALAPQRFAVEMLTTGLVSAWRKHGSLDTISQQDLATVPGLTLLAFPLNKP